MWRWDLAEKLAPYVVKIPQAFIDLNDQEVLDWFTYDNKWKQDINFNLGFGDAITNITNSESFETSSSSAEYQSHKRELEQIEDLIPVVGLREFRPDIILSNHTAIDGDFLDIRSRATVTLDKNAEWNSQIITANGDGSEIKVISDTQLRYKGQRGNSVTIRQEGTSIHWYLFSNANEKFWRAS